MVDALNATAVRRIGPDTVFIQHASGVGYYAIFLGDVDPGWYYFWTVFSERTGDTLRFAFKSVEDVLLAKSIAAKVDGVGPAMAARTVQVAGTRLGTLSAKQLAAEVKGLGPTKAAAIIELVGTAGDTTFAQVRAALDALAFLDKPYKEEIEAAIAANKGKPVEVIVQHILANLKP